MQRIGTSDLRPYPKEFTKLEFKPNFVLQKMFNEDLVAAYKIKEVLTLNKPAHGGMCILESSKTIMCDFPYKHIESKLSYSLLILIV